MQTCVLAMQSFMTLNDQDPFLCDLPPDHLFADSLPPTWSLGRDEDWIYISRLELNCRLYESEPSSEVLSHARPFYRLCRHAYDHKARKERPSATLSRDQFTPQFVAEVDRALKQFAEYADTDVLAAGEAFNTVFWTAVRAGSPELLKIALAETRWNVCCWCREPLADMLVECADKVRGEVLSLLLPIANDLESGLCAESSMRSTPGRRRRWQARTSGGRINRSRR
ncbi:hypothetical protein BCR44DRAFT_1176254 [Catenaria anguillulae PL171]|uniref:Uncharacterized protein n=1 Tax=Catenaria anguillulae PL171 TaxID=765915 RepID=A0A1Y2I2V6_9FUNG|nr:hypothetical protein BCR44DRAFT_1176254 [Catenaria anguillulae PL171]